MTQKKQRGHRLAHETDLIKCGADDPGFYGTELCISADPVSYRNAKPASDPDLFLRIYLRKESRAAIWPVCGNFTGSVLQRSFSFYTLLFINIGYFNGICTQYYYEDYINLPLVMSLVNELIYNLYIYVFRFLIRNRLDFLYYAREIIIPELIFTVVTTLLIYRFFLSANRRLDEMDNRREREY